jgi:hypothetical protein
VAHVTGGLLPDGQTTGSYRDRKGRLHVLTRTPGRIALFAAGGWGDPRRVAPRRPTLTVVGTPAARTGADGELRVGARLTLDSQARLSLAVLARGTRLRLETPDGRGTTLLRSVRLAPGAFALRLRVAPGEAANGAYRLRVTAVDPYRRRSVLTVPVAAPR